MNWPRQTGDAHPILHPWNREQQQPASYDVTLRPNFFRMSPPPGRQFIMGEPEVIDPEDPDEEIWERIDATYGDGFVLAPGDFALGVTVEYLSLPWDLLARVEGKSTLGRLGLIVHATAGFVDPGFMGRVTLELKNLSPRPIALRPVMRIAQLAFERLSSKVDHPYVGRYQLSDSLWPVLPRKSKPY